jgi:hypothetical protein
MRIPDSPQPNISLLPKQDVPAVPPVPSNHLNTWTAAYLAGLALTNQPAWSILAWTSLKALTRIDSLENINQHPFMMLKDLSSFTKH